MRRPSCVDRLSTHDFLVLVRQIRAARLGRSPRSLVGSGWWRAEMGVRYGLDNSWDSLSTRSLSILISQSAGQPSLASPPSHKTWTWRRHPPRRRRPGGGGAFKGKKRGAKGLQKWALPPFSTRPHVRRVHAAGLPLSESGRGKMERARVSCPCLLEQERGTAVGGCRVRR